jgi:hypothetical protein
LSLNVTLVLSLSVSLSLSLSQDEGVYANAHKGEHETLERHNWAIPFVGLMGNAIAHAGAEIFHQVSLSHSFYLFIKLLYLSISRARSYCLTLAISLSCVAFCLSLYHLGMNSHIPRCNHIHAQIFSHSIYFSIDLSISISLLICLSLSLSLHLSLSPSLSLSPFLSLHLSLSLSLSLEGE